MTHRLYYHDSYQTTFEARVLERGQLDGQPAVVLDQTCFYPTSGGQPADSGRLDSARVLDVTTRADGGAIWHILDGELTAVQVQGQIDWLRRFDHMQQHTGQHILSQAFIKSLDANTVSFHMGAESATIDLDIAELSPAAIQTAERLANEIVWQDRAVHIRIVEQAEAKALPLRKIPDIDDDTLRLIEIEDFDLTACGGTHVARTGAVGMIKLLRIDKQQPGVRVTFVCGGRALADYDEKHAILSRLANQFTTGYWELETVIDQLRQDNKEAGRLIRRQQAELAELAAEHYIRQGRQLGDATIACQCLTDGDSATLRQLAAALTRHPGTIALLGLAGDKAQLLFSRAADAPGDMNQLLQIALPLLGPARGGGNRQMAQGGGPAADEATVAAALEAAAQALERSDV